VTALIGVLHMVYHYLQGNCLILENLLPGEEMHKLDQLDPNALMQLALLAQEEIRRRGFDNPVVGEKRAPKAARIFQVPDSVKYLDPNQLETLTRSFREWLNAARDARTRQARTRIWLLFLILRYTGMRLGEVLYLDDTADFDLARGVVMVRGDAPREIPLPAEVVDALAHFFEHPMSMELRGQIFRMDQGYVRRKFSERGLGTGIPRELLNPRVLRHSRAVELLRGGVPLVVVDAMLGHQSPSSQYVSFSDADTRRIMNHYILEEKKMKTSARNMFVGQISAIREGTILSEVEVTTATGLKVVSVITKDSFENLGLAMGMTVIATVKAPWVVLVKEDSMLRTSARNKFCGKISAVNTGQIAAEVVVDLADGTKITSLITDESVSKLDLKVGDDICAMVKAFSVILALE
jgi:molybdate transport system regulatory protein